MSLFIASVATALIISFLCSLAEAAVLSLTPAQVAKMAQANPSIADIWRRFKKNIDRPISAILLLNTAAHTIGAAVAGAQFDQIYGDEWIWVFSLLLTFVMLQWTEIAPKTLGVRHNYRIALLIGRPLHILILFLQPILKLLNFINRPFSRGGKTTETSSTLEELNSMASLARLSNIISPDQERIIQSVPKLNSKNASQIMIPIEQVVFIKAEHTIKDAIAVAQHDPHTRFPVYANDSINNIVGYVNLKELIFQNNTHPEDLKLQPIRPITFVGPLTSAERLLRMFIDERIHIAIVESDGKPKGLITMEDIIEEMIGDLEDEFDRLPKMFQQVSPEVYMVGGGLTVQELNFRMGTTIHSENKETVSDWFVRQIGRTPKTGEAVTKDGKTFQVRRLRRGKVFEAIVQST